MRYKVPITRNWDFLTLRQKRASMLIRVISGGQNIIETKWQYEHPSSRNEFSSVVFCRKYKNLLYYKFSPLVESICLWTTERIAFRRKWHTASPPHSFISQRFYLFSLFSFCTRLFLNVYRSGSNLTGLFSGVFIK